jgi:hypothetical protein
VTFYVPIGSRFLSVIRSLLYYDVEVKAEIDESNASVILSLLAQNKSSGRSVVKLKLIRLASHVPDHELEDLPTLIDLMSGIWLVYFGKGTLPGAQLGGIGGLKTVVKETLYSEGVFFA